MSNRLGTQADYAFRSRLMPGQILSVDGTAGTCTVRLLYSNEQHTLDLPCWVSAQGLNSAWVRGVPQVRDFVDVAFDPVNKPFIVRMAVPWSGDNPSGAYASLTTAATGDAAGFGTIFRTLAPGEFDLRSSGGAGYLFTATGHAVVNGGPTALELDASRAEAVGTGNLWAFAGDGTSVRWGDVKRLAAGGFVETPAVVVPTSAPVTKELNVVVGGLTPAGIALVLADQVVGDVRDGQGAPVIGDAGVALRSRSRLYGVDGFTPVLTVTVDVLGNVAVTQAAGATAGVTASLTSLDVATAFGVSVTAGTDVSVGNVSVSANGSVSLAGGGETASDGVALGSALSTWLTTELSVLTALGPSGPAVLGLTPGAQYSANVKASV